MSAVKTIQYAQPFSFVFDYLKLFLGRRAKFRKGQAFPSFTLRWDNVRIDQRLLARYRNAASIGDTGQLPILYPQVLSLGMQLAILKHPTFPLSAFGAVHQRNHVLQHRPISDREKIDLECGISGTCVVKHGLEFDVKTVAVSGPAVLWEGISTYLFRGSIFGEPAGLPDIAQMPDLEQAVETREWIVPTGMGRRYARISGDYNPIHISSVLAKLFKFPRAIAHGMWSAAVCATHVPLPDGPVRYDLAFKGPVFLGSEVRLLIGPGEPGTRFDLFCANNPRPCLKGWVRSAVAGDSLLPR